MLRNAIVSTFGFLCTGLVVIPTLISIVVAFQTPNPGLGLLLAGCVFLVSAFFAGGAITLVNIADNTREALEVLRRMERAERATRNPAPQSHQAFTAAADGKTVGTAPTEVYRGYQYRITEKGEAELKLSNGNWRTLPSIDELKAYVNALTGNVPKR
jgi:hypothetical protein